MLHGEILAMVCKLGMKILGEPNNVTNSIFKVLHCIALYYILLYCMCCVTLHCTLLYKY